MDVMPHRLLELVGMIDTDENEIDVNLAQFGLDALQDLHKKERREERNHRHDQIG